MTQTYTITDNDAYNNAQNDKQKLNKITHIVIHRKHEHTITRKHENIHNYKKKYHINKITNTYVFAR